MSLTLAQRLQLLEKRRDDFAAWRMAREWPVEGWTFTAPGAPPTLLRLGDPWPQVDQSVAGGPVRFAAEFQVPASFAGRMVELELDVGGEGFVQITSSALTQTLTGGLNEYHRAFRVAGCAMGGEKVRVEIEAVPKGLFGTPNPAPRLTRAHLVAPEAAVQGLLLDLTAVLEAARVLGGLQTGRSPREGTPGNVHEVVPHLLAAAEAALADLEWPSGTSGYLARISHGSAGRSHAGDVWDRLPDLPAPQPLPPEIVAGIERARVALAGHLDRVRALYPPSGRLALSGHAHIDLAWLWPVAETRRKLRRTFHTLLELMDRYPELLFGQSSAQVFAWLEEDDPALLQALQARAREGRFEPVGGMWVEPDCQMTGGESLARQLLYGQRYFKARFGHASTVAWLPDTFGFTSALPQLLLQAGIGGFFTTKLNWNETTVFPYDLFEWEGLDGSRVRAHTFYNPAGRAYNGLVEPLDLLGTWRQFQGQALPLWMGGEEIREPESLFTFGHGDGGGGPASEHLELYARLRDFPALPRLRMSRVDDFFASLPREGLPVWVGELYLEFHRGVLTSQARLKWLNRAAEARLLEAEAFASLAHLAGHAYPAAELEAIWKNTLLNQFHDILPGSSIREVNVVARAELEEVVTRAAGLRDAAVRALTAGENHVGRWAIANSALHDRPLSVLLPGASGAVHDADGQPLPAQPVEGGLLVHAPGRDVSALSLLELRAEPGDTPPVSARVQTRETADGWILGNTLLEVLIGTDGTLHRIYDKQERREVLEGRGNRLIAHFDLPREYDAWDVAPSIEGEGEEIGGVETLELIEAGPLRAALRVTRRWRESRLTQTYRLRADSRRIEIHTRAEWHERRTLVKAVFELKIRTHEAWFETAFGAVSRPTHRNSPGDAARFEVAGHRWADLGESGYGVSLLNDSKYGHSALGGTLALTLLRGPMYPDPTADEGEHEFSYALFPTWGAGTRPAPCVRPLT
ncbi:alpha-mannosidase [Deinococcus sp. LM3]|uniref:alpha-mannosidase n=1 Tax=Deinococcus sp. LM3 TaxID=1938608 RepID=UPI00196BB2D4|nr:alpha-mannosidase [Deinococcus sp. LM3]